MIEYRDGSPMKVWSVLTFNGGEARAWPVQYSLPAGVGQAVMAVSEILERDYTVTCTAMGTVPGGWLITGTPDCPDGYPKKYTVMAYVLPTTLPEV